MGPVLACRSHEAAAPALLDDLSHGHEAAAPALLGDLSHEQVTVAVTKPPRGPRAVRGGPPHAHESRGPPAPTLVASTGPFLHVPSSRVTATKPPCRLNFPSIHVVTPKPSRWRKAGRQSGPPSRGYQAAAPAYRTASGGRDHEAVAPELNMVLRASWRTGRHAGLSFVRRGHGNNAAVSASICTSSRPRKPPRWRCTASRTFVATSRPPRRRDGCGEDVATSRPSRRRGRTASSRIIVRY
jgi:hypothetical protein